MKVSIYTDGSCNNQTKRNGGFGVILHFGNDHHTIQTKEFHQGQYINTTSIRMELMSVIVGLEQLKSTPYPVEIYSDNKYVVDSVMEGWVFGWEELGWLGRKNSDLWKRFLVLYRQHKDIKLIWVKGHSGHQHNERCDELARIGANSQTLINDKP